MPVKYVLKDHIQPVESAPRSAGILDQREITIQSYQTTVPFDFAMLDTNLGAAWLSPRTQLGVFSRSSSSEEDGCSAVLGLQDKLTVRAYNYEARTPLWYSWRDVIVETASIRYYRGSDGLLWFITTGGGRRITEEKLEEFNKDYMGIPPTAVTKQLFDLAKLRKLCFSRFVSRLYMVRFTDPSGKEYRSIDHALVQSREHIDPDAPRMKEVRADKQVKIESFDSDIEIKSSDLSAPVRVRFFIRGLSGALRLRFPKLILRVGTTKPEKQAEAFYRIVNVTRDSILNENYYQENQDSLECLHTEPDLFPETVDLATFRKVLNKPASRETFFAELNLNESKTEWGPHLLAIDQLLLNDVMSVDVKRLLDDMAIENPLMAAKLLDVCRTEPRLSRLGAISAGSLCSKLHGIAAETRAQAEGAFLAWAVEREKDGWDVDADSGEISVQQWRGQLDSMTLCLRMKVVANLMDLVHTKLMSEEGDVGLHLKQYHWCVEAAKALPSNHADCPPSLRLIVEDEVPMSVLAGSKVLKNPVADLAALDDGVLKDFGLPLWPMLNPSLHEGKIVISNTGIGAARSLRILQTGELPGVNGARGVDLCSGKDLTLAVQGEPTELAICFTKYGKELRANVPVVAAQPAPETAGQPLLGVYPDGAKLDAIIGKVQELKGAVAQSVDANSRVRAESERRKIVIEEMADGPDKFLAGMRARITEPDNVNLFMCLIEKTTSDGKERYLSYSEIGERMEGVTKQAVNARVNRFKVKYPEVWDYVDSVRNPQKPVDFSEMAPSERRKRGIDESYNYDAR